MRSDLQRGAIQDGYQFDGCRVSRVGEFEDCIYRDVGVNSIGITDFPINGLYSA